MVEIIPAILTDSSLKFKELVRRIEPYAARVHIDVADGVFVPNKTLKGYEELRMIESALKFDVHLMVQRPQDLLKEWYHTHVERFFIHVESEVNLSEVINEIHGHGRRVGIVLNPETAVDKIDDFLDKIDYIQFMAVHPGFQGQGFLNEVVKKVSDFHDLYPNIPIGVDGGITPETAPKLVEAGASILISGSYIINSDNVEKAIEELRKAVVK